MIKHSLAVEACLRELARYFNQNEISGDGGFIT
jgi:predicted hydrolase (HD superfamily)